MVGLSGAGETRLAARCGLVGGAARLQHVADTTDATDDYNWIGSTLYTPGHQSACVANGTQLVCAPATLPSSVTGL